MQWRTVDARQCNFMEEVDGCLSQWASRDSSIARRFWSTIVANMGIALRHRRLDLACQGANIVGLLDEAGELLTCELVYHFCLVVST